MLAGTWEWPKTPGTWVSISVAQVGDLHQLMVDIFLLIYDETFFFVFFLNASDALNQSGWFKVLELVHLMSLTQSRLGLARLGEVFSLRAYLATPHTK